MDDRQLSERFSLTYMLLHMYRYTYPTKWVRWVAHEDLARQSTYHIPSIIG